MIVTAIDPGACTGWAVFVDRVLYACGAERDASAVPVGGDLVVIERPQIYRASKSKGDPNDLITLALLAGRYQERALVAGARVELVLPAAWKGSVPKAVHNKRVLASLTPQERALVPDDHNAIDAAGLGKWRLERTS